MSDFRKLAELYAKEKLIQLDLKAQIDHLEALLEAKTNEYFDSILERTKEAEALQLLQAQYNALEERCEELYQELKLHKGERYNDN